MPEKKNICRYCKEELPPKALFCPWCGEKQIRARKKKPEPKYPKYRVLADGSLLGQLMVNGQRETIKADSEEEYKARVDALRTGILEMKKRPEKRPLQKVLRDYIDKNDGVLSPSTIRGYEIIYKNRFKKYITLPICDIDFQSMIKAEIQTGRSAKTIQNSWGLVSAACRSAEITLPDVNLPQVIPVDGDFLDYEQIQVFLSAVKGDPVECAALLMLHSLRLSELLKLSADQISGGIIHVRGAVVQDKNNKMVEKATNKNMTSRRDIPIMIPRLQDLLPESGPVVTIAHTTLQRRIKDICTAAGLPACSPHDLRRSFASLAKHLGWTPDTLMKVGGWSNMATVNKVYAKLAEADKNADILKMQRYYGFTTKSEKASN